MAVFGVPSPDLTNTFVAPGRFLPELLAPQIPRQAPLERSEPIDTERFLGKARRIESPRELVNRTVDQVNGMLGQFKVGIGVRVEAGQGRPHIVVRERASSSLLGEISAGQLLSARTRMSDAADMPGAGFPTGLFLSQHY